MNGNALGKLLMALGIAIFVVGVVIWGAHRFGLSLGLGRLPGDITYSRGPVTFHFPIVTCLLISILLTVVLNFFFRR